MTQKTYNNILLLLNKILFLIQHKKLREVDIQPTDRIVNIHIPKTAGMTFSFILQAALWGFEKFPKQFLLSKSAAADVQEMNKFQFITGHFEYSLFSEDIFPEGFIGLTFLRNPVSRTVSYFKFIYQQFKHEELVNYEPEIEPDKEKERRLTDLCLKILTHGKQPDENIYRFIKFLKDINYDMARNVVDVQTKVMAQNSRKNTDEEVSQVNLDLAKKRLGKMAYFGITERFQDSLFLLSYIFGWRPLLNNLYLNITAKSDYTAQLTPKALDDIQEQVAFDLQLYEFGKQLFEQRFNEMTETLLRRYGKKEHARLKRPLSVDLMMEFLEQHYIQRRDKRSKSKINTGSTFFLYTPSMFVEGPFGWYPLETSTVHGDYRWSGPGVQSGFDLPCPSGKNFHISFCLIGAIQVETMNNLSLSINGVLIDINCVIDSDGKYMFSGTVPDQAIHTPFLRLVFSVPRTIAPNQVNPNSKDDRSLGIALIWVKLQAQN